MTPVSLCNAVQNALMNSGSRSDTISSDKPFLQYQCSKNSEANSSAVISVLVGIMQISTPSLSIIATIQLYPSSSDRGPTKSRVTQSPQFVGADSECRRPGGEKVIDLFYWHSLQEEIYMDSISFLIFNQ